MKPHKLRQDIARIEALKAAGLPISHDLERRARLARTELRRRELRNQVLNYLQEKSK